MISRALFESWLGRALRFANLPNDFAARDADAILAPPIAELEVGDFWEQPGEDYYRALRRVWVRSLELSSDPARHALLRKWCVAEATFHGSGSVVNARSRALAFDEDGAPQLTRIHADTPAAMLAVVMSELIAPAPAFGFFRCAKCGTFTLLQLRSRARGRPRSKFCANPDCRKSTPRVHKFRSKLKSKKRNRHA